MNKTRRLTAVALVLLLLLSLCGCMAEEPSPAGQGGETTAAPTQGRTIMPYSGRLLVLIKDDYFDASKEYNAEDFPGIEIAQVETEIYRYTMGHLDKSFATQVVYVTLRNTSNSYFEEAVSLISRLPFVYSAGKDEGIQFPA